MPLLSFLEKERGGALRNKKIVILKETQVLDFSDKTRVSDDETSDTAVGKGGKGNDR